MQISEKIDIKENIFVKGARVHNLKNVDVIIPRNKLVVITGLSGSGKSSLAFDTIFAEGQRRYVESLSSYARQFVWRMDKPDVDYIKGISPAIAIEQKSNTKNPRSTVGTSTEIYEYLKLLFSRIGKTYSPVSGQQVKRHSVDDVTEFITSQNENLKIFIYSPLIIKENRILKQQLQILYQQGFSKIKFDNDSFLINDIIENYDKSFEKKKGFVIIDRIVIKSNIAEDRSRIADSLQTAFYEGEGSCMIEIVDESEKAKEYFFSNKFELDGITFEEPVPDFFSFNNPYGACKTCEGFGKVMGIDEDLVIPNKSLSIYQDAVACWKGEKLSEFKDMLVMNAYKFHFPIHKPYYELTDKQKKILWNGNEHFHGLNDFFKYVEEQTYKIQYRVLLSRYRGKTDCPDCHGTRLRKDANYVKIAGKSIAEIITMPVSESYDFFNSLKLNEHDIKVSKRLLLEISNRLEYLNDVGLGYLTLNRLTSSLSGGEFQRMRLATSIGSNLVGSMYILDEPSIGLHSRDTDQLINVLQKLKNNGNTVIVVEHDEKIIRSADYIVDIGLMAGKNGGEIIFQGENKDLIKNKTSITSKYLNKELQIETPVKRREWKEYLEIKGARENNLKNINVKFPLNVMTVITGVSGSGKSSLVKNILFPSLCREYQKNSDKPGKYDKLDGDISYLSNVEFVDQNPIGRSSRSNPVTYVKAFEDIRTLFSNQQLSKLRGYTPGYFSFNVPGGRCDECNGDGEVVIEMQFMADIHLTCDVCKGKRYKDELLEVKYKEHDINDILNMTVDEAIELFSTEEKNNIIERKIVEKLKPFSEIGLGYVHLGQSSSTLSGGEAQRVKLGYFIGQKNTENKTLFIFDEPTTGLHFHDINKLLIAFNSLLNQGHSIIVIEHNPEVIKCADWIIDLGPEGGNNGGNIVFEGKPEDMVKCKDSYTGIYLNKILQNTI
ncbi:MAG: excinuclease ABC subunit UvrA [Bacteroidales bacterium]|nr:excinuclease ABC subunit UvrA [Bacteroidales bacterium]